ncbi:winged helix-turn-helix transcriptional regulator [Dactylosporangium maewongense]|uniref:winged helix-turn-helix transcriptional regulator n=1 Tax=Dactylosporangium TaxID=35753 RepID=UPI0031D9A023
MVLDVTEEDCATRQALERLASVLKPPQHVEYVLTVLGKTLREPLAVICAWAVEHRSDDARG